MTNKKLTEQNISDALGILTREDKEYWLDWVIEYNQGFGGDASWSEEIYNEIKFDEYSDNKKEHVIKFIEDHTTVIWDTIRKIDDINARIREKEIKKILDK